MGLLSHFDFNVNFWDLNPQFKITEPFKSLYEKDKNKKKEESSKTMWFVAFCYDLSPDNIYRKLSEEEKQILIGEDFIGNKNFYQENKDLLDPLIITYCNLHDDEFKKHFREWKEILEKRSNFLKDQEYDLDNFEAIDKMAVGTEKIYSIFKKIEQDLERNESTNSGKGGKIPSLSDSGDI